MLHRVIEALARRVEWPSLPVILVLLVMLAACSGSEESATIPPPTPSTEQNTASQTVATIEVDRAGVFAQPDRAAEPFTYLYQREQVTILGRSADSAWLLTNVDGQQGWILSAQASLNTDPAQVAVISTPTPASPTVTPLPPLTDTPPPTVPRATPTPDILPSPTKTMIPTIEGLSPDDSISAPTHESISEPEATPAEEAALAAAPTNTPSIRLGGPPPLAITLPDGWQSGHILLPFRAEMTIQDVPLSIYEGPLPGNVTGHIYLFWGFPNIASATGQLNLWADGLQLLRGAMVDSSCNLGIDTQKTFYVGGHEATGTFYTAIDCEGETDTAGWFAALQVGGGNFAFFTAVEPLGTLPEQLDNLQAILNTVVFETDAAP